MWSSIKSILKGNDKCIIVEDGQPRYVILPFAEYQQLQKNRERNIIEENSNKGVDAPEEHVNKEIQVRASMEEDEPGDTFSAPIRIEDLPF